MLPRLLLAIVVSVVLAKETTTKPEVAMDTEADTDTETEFGTTDANFFPSWLIDSTKEPGDMDTLIISSRKPRVTGRVKGGTICLNTDECGRGKCCLRRSKSPRRRCRRLQRADERCTEEQMMGGYYYGFCPCNKNSVCMYINGTQKCVATKKTSLKPMPLPTGTPQANATQEEGEETPGQEEAQEIQDSEEVYATPKPPSRRPAFNLTGNQRNEIPEFLRKKMHLTPAPPHFPGTPLPAPTNAVNRTQPSPAMPVITGGGARTPSGTPTPRQPPGPTLTSVKEGEGLPGLGSVPGLPPVPVTAPAVRPGGIETGLPGQGGVPPLPPPPPIPGSAPLPAGARSPEQPPLVPPLIASAVSNAPPFDFNAVDGNQQRIL